MAPRLNDYFYESANLNIDILDDALISEREIMVVLHVDNDVLVNLYPDDFRRPIKT